MGRIGPKSALVVGLGALGLALVLFARMPVDGAFAADVLLPSILGAVGMSLAYIPAMITATAGARAEDAGLASGLVNTTYQVGSAIGLAAMVALSSGESSLHDGFAAAFIGAAVIAFVAAGLAVLAIRTRRATPVATSVATMSA